MSLLALVRKNDDQAWEHLVHLYGPLVHRWCRRAGLREEDVADVFQETFRAVAAHLENFTPQRGVGSFRSWLRTIVRTKVNDHFRRLRKHPAGLGGSDAQMRLANVVDPLADDDEQEVEEDNAVVVQRAMEMIEPEFSPQNWSAFKAVAIDGQSATDVAHQLGVQPQAVRQANYRIRRRLRGVLQDLVDD